MTYYNIHTHQPAQHPGDIAVISVDLSDGSVQKGILSNEHPFEKQDPIYVKPSSQPYRGSFTVSGEKTV
jgi:hypothetical protein